MSLPLLKVWEHFRFSHIDRYGSSVIDYKDSAAIHRALLHRCSRVYSNAHDYTDFCIREIGGDLYLYTDHRRDFSRTDTVGTAADMAAAYTFWAWELKRQQEEVTA